MNSRSRTCTSTICVTKERAVCSRQDSQSKRSHWSPDTKIGDSSSAIPTLRLRIFSSCSMRSNRRWKNSSQRWLPYSRSALLCDSNAGRSTGLVAASSPAGPTRASAAHENTVRSPRSMLKPVVLSNARHCSISSISPVGPVPGSRAAGEFETRSACWRQLAVVQYIPVGILCLKRSGILSCPDRALGACRADHANRHHRCNNGSSESNHSRTPNDCGFRAEHSR